MMIQYSLSYHADKDLKCVLRYGVITFGWGQGTTYYEELLAHLDTIAEQPNFYPLYDRSKKGYRRSVFRSHQIYYRVRPSGDVWVARIIGKQKFP